MGFSTVPCNEFVEVLGSKDRFRAVAELLHWLALSAQRLATWLVR